MDYYGPYGDYHAGFYSSSAPLTARSQQINAAAAQHRLQTVCVNPTAVDVDAPSYYTAGRRYEPAKVIADWSANYNIGTIIAYASRIGRKPPEPGQTRAEKDIEDLQKIIRHAELEIEAIQERRAKAQPIV